MITHTHSDHIAGIDDLRVFYWVEKQKIPIYASKKHLNDLITKVFHISLKKDPKNLQLIFFHHLNQLKLFMKILLINDIEIKTLYQIHGSSFSYGFIFNDKFGYSTDLNDMPENNYKHLYKIPIWIVESLRETPHQAHAHFDLTFDWIKKLNLKQFFNTFELDSSYNKLLKLCPKC